MKGLIVTADDFGAAREVNDAVEAAHLGGVLTAASLMVSGSADADAIARARRMPSLRVGLHLVLVEGRSVLPASRIPDLVDRTGHFRNDMARAGARMFFSPRAREQLAAEIEAQFEAFRLTGLKLDHVNAHKHFHLHPAIGNLMLGIGQRYGMCAARVPLEPRDVLLTVEPDNKPASDWLTAPFARRLRRRFRSAGVLVPDAVFGLAWSGRMTNNRMLKLIQNIPEGLSEIYLHPSTGPYEGSAPGYCYREEFSALTSPEIISAARDSSLKLGGFADFLKDDGSATVQSARSIESNRSLTL